jgi:hypothetical protein
VRRTRPPSSLALAAALSSVLGWGACNYGSVDPPQGGGSDAATAGGGGDQGDENGDDGTGDGTGGTPDAGGGGGAIEHASFPIEAGTTHGGYACNDCHTDLANPTDANALACTSCHDGAHDDAAMADTHSAGPGVGDLYEWSAPACLTCHPQAEVYKRDQHNNRVRQEGHTGIACSGCHPSQSDLTPSTFADTTCTPCHSGGGGDDD